MYPTYLKVVSIGSVASGKISKQGVLGEIHAVFERSFHIVTQDNDLICVVNKDIGKGPINLVVDIAFDSSMSFLCLKVGLKVTRIRDLILIENDTAVLSLEGAEIWTPRKLVRDRILEIESINCNLDVIRRVAREKAKLNRYDQISDHRERTIQTRLICDQERARRIALPRILKLAEAISRRDIKDVKRNAKNLAGLGPGLTPSADDELVGLMTGIFFVAENLHWDTKYALEVNEAIIVGSTGRTTLVSQELMKCAATGNVAESIMKLVKAVLTATPNEVTWNTEQVLSMGGTSGNDLVSGLLLGLHLALNTLKPLRRNQAGSKKLGKPIRTIISSS